MVETSQKLKLADLQIETLKRSITHAQLTDKEISQLPTETKTYESVGRMFVLKEVPEARMNLDNKKIKLVVIRFWLKKNFPIEIIYELLFFFYLCNS